jgi:pimeloyl-ACP methyl ester carboxylesterase
MSTADADGDAVRVRVGPHTLRSSTWDRSTKGPGGRPLVLLNGLGMGLETWAPFRRALGHRPTVALDLPGTGGSSTPAFPPSIGELARATVGALDALGCEEFDLLGFSFGGTIAQELARTLPSRVVHLVLAATNWGVGSPLGNLTGFAAWCAANANAAAGLRAIGPWWQMLAVSTWSSWPWLGRLQQPTLVLAAADDQVVPLRAAEHIAATIPRATLVVVAGAGHGFLLDSAHVEVAARLVAEHLDDDEDVRDLEAHA